MQSLVGLYGNRNRLQVWLSLVVFTLCAWWTLNPRSFHLLDGTSITIALMLGALFDFNFPFNVTSSWPDAAFLLVTVSVPFLLHVHFLRNGLKYMAALNIYWFAYAAQNCFRLLDAKIYRWPATLFFVLSLALTVVALIKCLQSSETRFEDGFKEEIDEFEHDENGADL
ncbi:MAG: hypothetical protein CVV42_00440 [Candidatus Riflebacteria bacterium HGW-Riflebacteria-2]|jgi:hypothetical protein|nr:MAG: hypothetical protein CVV42_00440 [Candidatus Riflebacteria bacterium HGW-Riflebacteria-2]